MRLELQNREKEREIELTESETVRDSEEITINTVTPQRLKVLTSSALKSSTEPQLDISKQIQFVPPFQDKEVDKYLLHFKKIAKA